MTTNQQPDDTDAVRSHYDETARKYNRQISFFERILFGGGREWVCSQAHGDVLEIAAGTGRNLRHYPHGVRLTTIELSPEMLEIARREASSLGQAVDQRVGDAQTLEFPDNSFDTVVCTLGLCTIPDDRAAVREAKRVPAACNPGRRAPARTDHAPLRTRSPATRATRSPPSRGL